MNRLLPFALFVFVACTNFSGGTACTLNIVPGVVVKVYDAATGLPTAAGARGSVTDGAYTDSLRGAGMTAEGTLESLAGADERPGLYTVQVHKAGYVDWSRSGVLVRQGTCHVQTVVLTANLAATL